MSLLKELEARGVTAEDLEKAAAVRLFEKAAAAEGVNLDDLDENRVEELFNHFVSTSTEKEASAMNDEIVELFEKTASAEGIDLDDMSDEDLAALYNHYIENVLPEQIAAAEEGEKAASANDEIVEMFQKTASAEGIDLSDFDEDELQGLFNHYVENVLPLQLGDEGATDKVADAQEKLAEAEILGRHMARAYMDEMEKEAGRVGDAARRVKDLITAKNVRSNISEVAGADAGKMDKLRAYGKILAGKAGNDMMTSEARKSLATQGGAAATTAGLAFGGKKLYDRKKRGQEKRSGFSELEVDALLKIAEESPAAAAEAKEGLMDKLKKGGSYIDEKAMALGQRLSGIGAGSKTSGEGKDAFTVRGVRGGPGVHRALGYGLPALTTAGAAFGAKKLYDRKKRGQEKQSSAFDYGDIVNATALQLLADAGYDV